MMVAALRCLQAAVLADLLSTSLRSLTHSHLAAQVGRRRSSGREGRGRLCGAGREAPAPCTPAKRRTAGMHMRRLRMQPARMQCCATCLLPAAWYVHVLTPTSPYKRACLVCGAQVVAVGVTIWLISCAMRGLRLLQAACAAAPRLLLVLCWPLTLFDLPESTSEVLFSLGLVACLNWLVYRASDVAVQYLKQHVVRGEEDDDGGGLQYSQHEADDEGAMRSSGELASDDAPPLPNGGAHAVDADTAGMGPQIERVPSTKAAAGAAAGAAVQREEQRGSKDKVGKPPSSKSSMIPGGKQAKQAVTATTSAMTKLVRTATSPLRPRRSTPGNGTHTTVSAAGAVQQVEMQSRTGAGAAAAAAAGKAGGAEGVTPSSSPGTLTPRAAKQSTSSPGPAIEPLTTDAWAMDAPSGLLGPVSEDAYGDRAGTDDGRQRAVSAGRSMTTGGRGSSDVIKSPSAMSDVSASGDVRPGFSAIFTKEGFDSFADSVKCE